MDFASVDWGSVADWVSGIGSLSAVITALYLANSSRHVKLHGYCGHRLFIGGQEQQREVISIVVTNVGIRLTMVNNIGIRVGLFNKRYALVSVVKDLYSDGIPKSISDGEQGHWIIPLDAKHTWMTDLWNNFIKSKLDVETIFIQVLTTNGGTKNIRPEKALREMINQAQGKIISNN